MSSDEEKIKVVRNATDLQRLKLEKLMKNPEKPAFIPERSKEKRFPNAPEFVRNVMGSSAGAGSGEFHVYRHIRRREYARQEYLNQLSEKDRLDLEYKEKLEENHRRTEERAARKRSKRQRAKQRVQAKRRKGGEGGQSAKQDTSSECEEGSDDEGGDLERSCDEEVGDKTEEVMPVTLEPTRSYGSAIIVDESNRTEALVEEQDANEVGAAAEEVTKGDAQTPVEQNDSANITKDTSNGGGAAEETRPSEDSGSRSLEKPQKKSLKELMKTTVSKLNKDKNIDR